MLGGIDGTVLAAGTSEAYHEVAESSFHVSFDGSIHQGVGMFQEREDFTVVFQKLDDRCIQTRERFVAFVLARIVHGTAIEHITAPVAGRVVGDAFLVGEAHDLDGELAFLQVVLELLQLCQLAEYGAEVRIFRIILAQQLSEVLDGIRNALDKVRFLFEIATETVGSQHLQGAEQDEMAQLAEEIVAVYRLVLAECLDVFVQQLFAQAFRITGLGLPEEGGHIVKERAFASALEIDEPRFTVLDHDIPALEVSVHEGSRRTAEQYIAHLHEVVFQLVFLEIQSRSFQETIFEVVQIPEDGTLVEFSLWIATVEVKSVSTGKLDARKQTDGLAEQFLFLFGEGVGDAAFLDGMEKEGVTQVFLQVAGLVFRYAYHLRYGQVLLLEMFRHVEERFIFFHASAIHPDQVLHARQPEIASVGTGCRHLNDFFGRCAGILLIEFL